MTNGYSTRPTVNVDFECNPSDFPSAVTPFFEFIMEEVGGVADCFSKIKITPRSDNLPASATARYHVTAYGKGAVKRA